MHETLLPDFDPVDGAGGEAGQRILDVLYTATHIYPLDKGSRKKSYFFSGLATKNESFLEALKRIYQEKRGH